MKRGRGTKAGIHQQRLNFLNPRAVLETGFIIALAATQLIFQSRETLQEIGFTRGCRHGAIAAFTPGAGLVAVVVVHHAVAFGNWAEATTAAAGAIGIDHHLGAVSFLLESADAIFEFLALAGLFRFELLVPHAAEDYAASAGSDSLAEIAALETRAGHESFESFFGGAGLEGVFLDALVD